MKVIFIVILLPFIWKNSASFCRCRGVTFKEQVEIADQIFIGTVLNSQEHWDSILGKYQTLRIKYSFKVAKKFKGSIADTISISSGIGGGDCGFYFKTGESYLVYSNNYYTSICSRTSLAKHHSDIKELEKLFDKANNKTE